jgi:ABC-type antimicrobial peptide transport system permease subunit
LSIALAGCAVGLVAALVFGRVIAGFLFETAPTDPMVLGCIGLLLICATALASYLPARRATQVDPMAALREN